MTTIYNNSFHDKEQRNHWVHHCRSSNLRAFSAVTHLLTTKPFGTDLEIKIKGQRMFETYQKNKVHFDEKVRHATNPQLPTGVCLLNRINIFIIYLFISLFASHKELQAE